MAEIVNLRQARKARAHADKEARAAENRAKFGTPKALQRLERAKAEQSEKRHEAHRLDDDPLDC